jgi:signal transduction histidine kinase
MKRLVRLPRIDRIATQIAALLVVASLASFLVTTLTVVVSLSDDSFRPLGSDGPARIASVIEGLNALPREMRPRLAAAYRSRDFEVALENLRPAMAASTARDVMPLKDSLIRELPSDVRLLSVDGERADAVRVVARLEDGEEVTLIARHNPPALLPPPLLVPLLFLIASTVLLCVWAARRLVAPLSRFADAADRFRRDGIGGNLLETGPAEIRRASIAFNRMRARLVRLMEDQSNLVMAISHDLRTPLTRLRLRAEELSAADAPQKALMLVDIAVIDRSITAAVSYLRSGLVKEAIETADLPSILETICDQFADAGHIVTYQGPAHLELGCRPRALQQAVTNLVDNATKYGSQVCVLLTCDRSHVLIEVQDDGPGIVDAEKGKVAQPFYRSDAARQDVRGFGLGLAIVASFAQAHQGSLSLLDNAPHGLRACLRFPVP